MMIPMIDNYRPVGVQTPESLHQLSVTLQSATDLSISFRNYDSLHPELRDPNSSNYRDPEMHELTQQTTAFLVRNLACAAIAYLDSSVITPEPSEEEVLPVSDQPKQTVYEVIKNVLGDQPSDILEDRFRKLKSYVDTHGNNPGDTDAWLEINGKNSHDTTGGRHAFMRGLTLGIFATIDTLNPPA
jgi:hypothetical protein